MSTTVDSKVLEMRFDNKQFEAGVATSMSTLDKLKSKLNLSGASKGLENIGNVTKNVKFDGIVSGVSALEKRFSVMGIVGMRVIENLTDSAMGLVAKLNNWFTGGIVQGGITRAMNLEKARFQLQGLLKDEEKVAAVMENVNASVDGTAYSLDQAAVVASQFAASGMEAGEKMESALRAVAGTAAMTSADYQRVGLIFTQVSGQGRLMGNDLLQLSNLGINAAATLAEHFGKTETEIRDMVSKGQVSFEMFAEAMDDAFGAHASKANETFTGAMSNIKAALARIGAEFVSPLVEQNGPLVKFFNTLREKINDVKNSIGPIAKTFTGFVTTVVNSGRKLVEKLDFTKPFKKFEGLEIGYKKLADTVLKAVAPVKKVTESVKNASDKVEKATKAIGNLGDVVDDVILGKFGNGQERVDKLTKAGENYYKIQNKVNETLGDSFRYSKEQIEAQDKLLRSQEKTNKSQEKTAKSTSKTEKETTKLTKAQKNQLKNLAKMSEEQAKANGCTDEQIKALRDLKETADKLGMPLDTFIDKMDEINGRWLIINSFKNIGTALSKILSSIGKGFREVFDPIKPEQLFNAIAALHKFTTQLIISDETADKLRRTFRGLFAAIDIVGRVLGSGVKIAFTVLSSVLEAFGVTALDVTANIGDLIYKFDEWLKEHDVITKFIESIADKIPPVIDKIKEFVDSLNIPEKSAAAFAKIAEGFQAVFEIMHGAISRSLVVSLKIINSLLDLFGTNLLEIGERVADYVIKLRDWLKENTLLIDGINKIASIIKIFIEGIEKCAKAFVKLEPVQKFIENIKDAFAKLVDVIDFKFDGTGLESLYNFLEKMFTGIESWIKSLNESKFFKAGLNIVSGLANGISTGIGKAIDAIKNVGRAILEAICGVLGIHSPSTEAKEIGENVIEGLYLGLQNGIPKIIEIVKSIGSNIISELKNIKMSDVVVIGTIVGMFVMLKKALNIADRLVSPIDSIRGAIDKLGGVIVSLDKYINAKTLEVRANAILTFAKAIAILAGSIFLLSRIEVGDLVKATAALAALVGLMTILMVVATKADGLAGFKFGKLSVLMVSLGISLTLLAFAMKKLADLDPEGSTRALMQLVTLIFAMTLVVGVYGKFVESAEASKNMNKAGKMLIKMAIAIGLLVAVIKLINTMSWKEIGKGAAVITGAMALLAAFSLLGNIPNKNVSKAGSMLLKMSIAIGILVMVIKLINTLTPGEIDQGISVISNIMIMFATLMMVSFLAGKFARRAGAMFLMMASAIGILVLTIKLIATIPDSDLSRSTQVIINIMTMFMSIMILSNFVGENAAKAGAMFLMMSVAVGMLIIAIKLIAGMSEEDINKGMNVIMSIEMLFMSIMILSSFVGANADKAGTMMLKMSAAILVLAGAIALLSILDPADIVRGTACISALLAMFALLTYVSQYASDSFKTMTVLAVTIGLLAASLTALSFLDTDKVVTATACMSVVIGMFALLVRSSDMVTSSMSTLIVLTVAVGMIGGMLYLLAQLPMESALGAATALSTLLVSMSVALMILNNANTVTPMALIALGGMVAATGLIAVVLGIMQSLDIQPSLETALALSTLLLAMSAACLILARVGSVASLAIAGALALDGVILAIGGFIVGIGALMEKVPMLEEFLARGIGVLQQIGYGLGSFIGSFAGGLLDGVTSGLPGVGSNLGQFMTNAKPFFDGLKGVDPSVAESAKSLASAILTITGAGILDAISKWLTGGTNMDTFGAQLVSLGKGMKAYAAEVAGVDSGAISASANAAKALVQVANNLPKEGGIWQTIAGTSDISSFASKLKIFGKGMKSYAAEVAGIDSSAISSSASAAQGLAQVAKSLPKEGGWAETILGSQDIASFGSKLKAFGKGMKSYANEVAGIDTGAITSSVSAAKGLVAVAKSLPKDGGWLQKIAGGKDMKSFASKLKSFGSAIKGYATEVAGVNTGAINSSVSAAKLMVGAIKSTSGLDTSGVKKFVAAVDKLGETDMESVATAFSGTATTAKMVSAGVKMVKSVGTGIKSSTGSVKSAAKSTASSIASSFSSQTSAMTKAGANLVSALAKGMTNKKSSILSAGKTLANSAKNGVTENKSGMTTAGLSLGEGLVSGIKLKGPAVYAAAYALGQLAVKGEKAGQKSNSPSKLTIKAGGWLGEGLIIGMKRMGSAVYSAGYDMGTTAVDSVSTVLNKLGTLVDSDMDIQPTIAPVMDLSNVEAGVGAIGGMFDRTMTIGANANINAINSMMNSRNQNGANADVVSAINKLRKDLGNVGGNTYNLGDITYDDGSNVADAIQTIVRAAKVERRK